MQIILVLVLLVGEIVLLREHGHEICQKQDLRQVVLPVGLIERALFIVDLA